MDQLTRAFYEQAFRIAFLEKRGEAFQDFFSSIMAKRYLSDFMRTRPWGSHGDRKNDGYLSSLRTLFQVYAPNDLSERETLSKIDEDYWSAIPYWKDYFNVWVFVHNSDRGLGPGVVNKLLALDQGHQNIRVKWWGYEELRTIVFQLSSPELASLLGSVPSRSDLIDVRYPEIEQVLKTLEVLPIQPVESIRPVPAKKLETNALSPPVGLLLKTGMGSSNKIRDYFSKHYDPNLGDRVAQAFHREYEALRNDHRTPDDIFAQLQRIGHGTQFPSASRQVATLVVLAYLFEECDIFERPSEDSGL